MLAGFDFRPQRSNRRNAIMSFHTMNRRTFLETATTLSAATLLTSRLGWAATEHKIEKVGVQLYTVRDLMKEDFDGTIAKVAKIGYKEVEFAGYFGRTGQQVRAACDKNGLDPVSTHVQYDELDDKFPSVIETSKTIGHKYIVCPWIPEERNREPHPQFGVVADIFPDQGPQIFPVGAPIARPHSLGPNRCSQNAQVVRERQRGRLLRG